MITKEQHDRLLRDILLQLAGHASMCWTGAPSGEQFDSKEAERAVDIAMQAIGELPEWTR